MYPKYPSVTDKEREELARKYSMGDESVRERFIACNMPLVISIARRYSNNGILGDLIQEGSIGLMRAAEKFDYTRGNKFATYATWWIRSAIGNYIKDQTPIRRPAHINEEMARANRLAEEFRQQEGRYPTEEELADEVAFETSKINELQKLNSRTFFSLDDMIGDDGPKRSEIFGHNPWESDLKEINRRYVHKALNKYLERLPPEQESVLRHRFYDEMSTSEIAKHMGMTKEKVKQTEGKAIRILKAISSTEPALRNLLEYV